MLRGDWLAPAPLNYYAICMEKKPPNVTYYYSGNSFFGSSGEDAVKFIESDAVGSVLIADPGVYPPSENYINRSLRGSEVGKIMNILGNPKKFHPVGHIRGDDGLLLFMKTAKDSR